MIKKYVLGQPIQTCATVVNIEQSNCIIPFFTINEADKRKYFSYTLSNEDIVYGLGQQVRGINKRGWIYTNNNFDNPHHQEDTLSLYGSHNFLIISGRELFGVFFDYPGSITFDIGYTHRNILNIYAQDDNMDIYIITGENESDIVKQFRKLIGKRHPSCSNY